MKHLLDPDGLRAIDAFCMANVLLAFDYDGTLAPIVGNPDQASMRAATAKLLDKLTSLVPVAIISGRSRTDLMRFLKSKIDFVVGNHGLEGSPAGLPSLEQAASSCQRWLSALSKELDFPGVSIEDKNYSLAVHYRAAADKPAAKARILEVVGSLGPSPRIVLGKCVVNLVSAGAPHKGVALLETMIRSGCRSAIYFGDDDNDEDVFRLGEESLLTVRIGKNHHSSALFYLDSQEEIDQALYLCLAALTRAGRSAGEKLI